MLACQHAKNVIGYNLWHANGYLNWWKSLTLNHDYIRNVIYKWWKDGLWNQSSTRLIMAIFFLCKVTLGMYTYIRLWTKCKHVLILSHEINLSIGVVNKQSHTFRPHGIPNRVLVCHGHNNVLIQMLKNRVYFLVDHYVYLYFNENGRPELILKTKGQGYTFLLNRVSWMCTSEKWCVLKGCESFLSIIGHGQIGLYCAWLYLA